MSTIKSSSEHLTLNADGSNKDVKIQNNGSESVIVKSDGNVGIGVTPESWRATTTALEVGGNGNINTYTTEQAGNHLQLMMNGYHNGTEWKYKSTDEASRYMQKNGEHTFSTAASGTADAAISFTTAMTIDNDGGVKVSGLVLDKTSQLVTEGGQITHNGCSFMALNATSGGISFAAAQIQNPYWEGQILVLRYTENPPARFTLSSSSGSGGVGAISLSGDWSPDWGDTLTLLAASATWWNELSRSTNTNY